MKEGFVRKVLTNVKTTNIFRCNCTSGYEGRDIFRCNCTSGYEGRVCEKSIDECKNNKCQNNASCLDR